MTDAVVEEATPVVAPDPNVKIVCQIDGQETHSVQLHIQKYHSDTWTLERYKQEFPDAPLMSPFAQDLYDKKLKEKASKAAAPAPMASAALIGSESMMSAGLIANKAMMHELFELGNIPAAMSNRGTPINVTLMSGHDDAALTYLQEVDRGYVFNIDLLRKTIAALELNMPMLLWGFHGTGKTTIVQQACARTKRPAIRVQHTINMQESDVLGQWSVRDNSTQFQLGPLPTAMLNGWVYIADEYDFAMPSVLAVYQPVLEGQSLLIKDAPPHLRKITPHPNFRFFATGNTNGCGDETGLYQGTLVQNAANYSRFKITEEVKYMEPGIEAAIIESKSGVTTSVAKQFVKFANDIRSLFRDSKITMTISPRELISAAQIGMAFGQDWRTGLQLAFCNRLPRIEMKVVDEYLQRVFK